jgi:hypothetical protein
MQTVPDSYPFPKNASSYSKAISEKKMVVERAWAFCPRPGIVVTETEIRDDPIVRELFDAWRAGDDATYRQFAAAPLAWTEDDPSLGNQ